MIRPPIVLAGCVLAAALGAAASGHAAKRPRVQCSQQTDASQVLRRATTSLRGTTYRLELTQRRDLASSAGTQTAVLRRGGSTLLTIETGLAEGTPAATRASFGRGFKGISTLELIPEGALFRVVVDGRRSQPFGAGGDAEAVVFEDGQPAPKVRRSPKLGKVLQKLRRQLEKTPCTGDGGAQGLKPRYAPEADGSFDCASCQFGCGSAYLACMAASVAPSVACLGFCAPGLAKACYKALELCTYDGCYGIGKVCCPAGCLKPDGGKQCCDVGNVCYESPVMGGGTTAYCCKEDRLCGKDCMAEGARCVLPARGWSCPADAPGELCTDPAAPERFFPICCRAGERCARPASTTPPPPDWPYGEETFGHLCCPAGSGEACGLTCCPGGKTCCHVGSNRPGDEPVCCNAGETCDGSSCCPAAQLCGGTCCPGPCVNGVCCAPGRGTPCGGQCCPGGFSSCCNGQCCNGPCVGGACCTPERACGTTCCADGWTCTDPSSGTCAPCGEGEKGCAPVAGNPQCCAEGTECCASGECCAAGSTCCTVNGVTGCRPANDCLR